MEEQRNLTNNSDLVSEREGRALEIFKRIDRHLKAALNRGMVWRKLALERAREMEYSTHRLEAATGAGAYQSSESDGATQAAGGFDYHLISGLEYRYINQGDRYHRKLENIWDSMDHINDIRPTEDYKLPSVTSNDQTGNRIHSIVRRRHCRWTSLLRPRCKDPPLKTFTDNQRKQINLQVLVIQREEKPFTFPKR